MFTFKVTPDEGKEFSVTADSRDIMLWEKTTQGRTLGKLKDDLRMADLYKIAYLAVARTKKFDGDQAAFEKTCVIEEQGDEEEADPTSPAP